MSLFEQKVKELVEVRLTTSPLFRNQFSIDFKTGRRVYYVTDHYDPALVEQRNALRKMGAASFEEAARMMGYGL